MDKEYIDYTQPTDAAAWQINNCSVCSKDGTDLCPYKGKEYKKRMPPFCNERKIIICEEEPKIKRYKDYNSADELIAKIDEAIAKIKESYKAESEGTQDESNY